MEAELSDKVPIFAVFGKGNEFYMEKNKTKYKHGRGLRYDLAKEAILYPQSIVWLLLLLLLFTKIDVFLLEIDWWIHIDFPVKEALFLMMSWI